METMNVSTSTGRPRSRVAVATVGLLLVLVGCGDPIDDVVRASPPVERRVSERVATAASRVDAPEGAPASDARPSPKFVRPKRFVRPRRALSEEGFVLEYASERKGAFGNTVLLDLYLGPTIWSPSGERLGRADLYFNAANVEGFERRVEQNLFELIALELKADPTAKRDVQVVDIKGRPGLFVHEPGGRSIVTACGDWWVQITTGARREWLSDDALKQIAANAQVR
jgi:hypothetical protein